MERRENQRVMLSKRLIKESLKFQFVLCAKRQESTDPLFINTMEANMMCWLNWRKS